MYDLCMIICLGYIIYIITTNIYGHLIRFIRLAKRFRFVNSPAHRHNPTYTIWSFLSDQFFPIRYFHGTIDNGIAL